jgi:hypothetical protein
MMGGGSAVARKFKCTPPPILPRVIECARKCLVSQISESKCCFQNRNVHLPRLLFGRKNRPSKLQAMDDRIVATLENAGLPRSKSSLNVFEKARPLEEVAAKVPPLAGKPPKAAQSASLPRIHSNLSVQPQGHPAIVEPVLGPPAPLMNRDFDQNPAFAKHLEKLHFLIPGRLAYVALTPAESSNLKDGARCLNVSLVSSNLHKQYVPLCADFGPVALNVVHRFCQVLTLWLSPFGDAESEICSFSAGHDQAHRKCGEHKQPAYLLRRAGQLRHRQRQFPPRSVPAHRGRQDAGASGGALHGTLRSIFPRALPRRVLPPPGPPATPASSRKAARDASHLRPPRAVLPHGRALSDGLR